MRVGNPSNLSRGRLLYRFLLEPLDRMACLVSKDQVPFISVSSAVFARANALSTVGKLLVALNRFISTIS